MRELIADGTDINFANLQGVTALMVACQWNRTGVVRFLLTNGADVNVRETQSGLNPLMYACLSGNPQLVSLILRKNPVVDSCDAAGRSALMVAATLGNAEAVKLLVQSGADINHIDHSGSTALDWARENGQQSVVDFFLARFAGSDRRT
ncbi:MAG: ankyrin repeat domain-containing protein [Desulfomonile tiedjei]|nr:ankyrin repeat domain-containing protein [Desulfomonile tiedjei]